MDNQMNQNSWSVYDPPAQPPAEESFPTGKREAIFGLTILLLGLLLANCALFGGANLGFALARMGCTAAAAIYLFLCGHKGNWYHRTVLGLCFLILPGFARTDDGFVEFVMSCFLFVATNLALGGMAGKNLWNPDGIRSLLDPFRHFFSLGFGKLGSAFRGIRNAIREGNEGIRNSGAVLLGLAIAAPLLLVMVPLLTRADAAFEGLLDLLPDYDFEEFFMTLVGGIGTACILYTRTVALNHAAPAAVPEQKEKKYLSPLTVNTALAAVCALYMVYLLSQLAYFVGGFSGILPEGFSLAEYARRGFFEMAMLCAMNLYIMVFAISLTEKRNRVTPLSTRIACLFIGLVTLFFVFAAGAKMVLYIGVYGMTRLRVLTMVIMVFLGLTTATVCIWLFLPKLPYMKVVVITALVMGAAVLWADVDSVVAGYNVNAYLSGRLETVDVEHLSDLGSGAVPHLDRLAREAADPAIREYAENVLRNWRIYTRQDLRAWNYTDYVALQILEQWPARPDTVLLPKT